MTQQKKLNDIVIGVFVTLSIGVASGLIISIFVQPVDGQLSPKYANLDVENYTGYQKGDYFYIIGQVINKDTVPYEFIEISFELFDNNSKFIGTSFTYAESDILYPNQTTTFRGIIGDTDVST